MKDPESKLKAAFLEASLKRSKYLALNDAESANEEYDKLHGLKNRMRQLPDRGEAALKLILEHEDLHTRMLAAASLLAIDEEFALNALEEIAALDTGLISSSAQLTAQEWKAGRLRDYWD